MDSADLSEKGGLCVGKKYLKVLLSLLFITLLGMYSTCYAIVTGEMTTNQAKYIFDFILSNTIQTENNLTIPSYYTANSTASTNPAPSSSWSAYTKTSMYNRFYSESYYENFKIKFNEVDLSVNNKLGVEHYMFIPYTGSNGTILNIVCIPVNNTIGNDLPFPCFQVTWRGSGNWKSILVTTYNENYENYSPFVIKIDNVGTATYWTVNSPIYFTFKTNDNTVFYSVNDTLKQTPYNILSLNNLYFYGASDLNSNNVSTSDLTVPYILKTFYNPPEEELPNPEIPSGDTNSGTIINPSGEVTGYIDLSGIENGISNINNSINQQGQNIVNAISGETQAINNLTENISQEYSGELGLSYSDIENSLNLEHKDDPYQDFWNTLLLNFEDCLTSSGEIVYEFNIRNSAYILSSNKFITPNNVLKSFLSLFINAWMLLMFVNFIKRVVRKTNEADTSVVDDVSADVKFF